MSSNKLAEKFMELTKGQKLWPPLNNYSPFIQGSEWNTKEFVEKYYDGDIDLHMILLINDKESVQFLPENGPRNTSAEIFQKYLKDQTILKKRSSDFYNNVEKIDELYSKFTYSYIKKTNWNSLRKGVNDIRNLIWEANALAFFVIYFEKDFCWEELQKAKFDISKDEFEEIWDKGTEAVYGSFDKEQLIYILDLFSNKTGWGEIKERCQYFYTSYLDVKNLDEVEEKLKKQFKEFSNSQQAISKIQKEQTEQENKIKEFRKWVSTLNTSQKILAEYFQEIIKIRDSRKNFFGKGLTIIWRVAQKMFNEANVSEDLIPFYTYRELIKGVDYLIENKNKIRDRKNGFILLIPYNGDVETENMPIEDAKKQLNEYYLSTHKDINFANDNIKGQIGNKGNTKGVVKIILNAQKADNFNDGDILVTGMTRPEFVPLMKRASAIVTDEGGITCHAAIVSRELDIPCIIGTKIVTKTLKDGDEVEVDADNGIVRIIKKAG